MNTHPFANKMMYGDRAVTVTARLAITKATGKQPIAGATRIVAGFVGFTDSDVKYSEREYEVWDCDIIIVPKRIYRNGPFVGHRIDQVVASLGGKMSGRFKRCEIIKPEAK